MRKLLRTKKLLREREGTFIIGLSGKAGIYLKNVSVQMIGRTMNEAVYKYLQATRKAILKKTDRKKRLSFAKKRGGNLTDIK